MPLQLILGNSGAGKSHYIFEKIIKESEENPGKQFLVIVPEQFTMQTQKDLVMMHPRRGIMNIDVLSFERLAHKVFDEVGGEHRRILEDTGKNLILRRLAEEKKDRAALRRLARQVYKKGIYTEKLLLLISEDMDDSTEELLKLWKAAEQFGLVLPDLEEQLMVQALFTERYLKEV